MKSYHLQFKFLSSVSNNKQWFNESKHLYDRKVYIYTYICIYTYRYKQRKTFFHCRKKRDSGESRFLNDNQDDEAEEKKNDELRRCTSVFHAWAKMHERVDTEKKHRETCSALFKRGTRSANDVYRLGR